MICGCGYTIANDNRYELLLMGIDHEEIKMPVPTDRLKMRVRLSNGNRAYVDLVLSPNDKLKPLYVFVDSKPEHHPEGVYHLRYLNGGKRVWDAVGSDPQTCPDRQAAD
jgi:hypothetical protein